MSQYNVIPLFPRPTSKDRESSIFTTICNNIVETEQKRYKESMVEAADKILAEDIDGQETSKQIKFQRKLYDLAIDSIDMWFPYLFAIYNVNRNEYNFRRIRHFLNILYVGKGNESKLDLSYDWIDDLADMLKIWNNYARQIEDATLIMAKKSHTNPQEACYDSQVRVYASLKLFQSETDLNEFVYHINECLKKLGDVLLLDLSKLLMNQLGLPFIRKDYLAGSSHPEINMIDETCLLLKETSSIYMYYLANYLSTLVDSHSIGDLRSQYIEAFETGTLWTTLDLIS